MSALSLGSVTLARAALAAAHTILSVPGQMSGALPTTDEMAWEGQRAAELLGMVDSLLAHLDSAGAVEGIGGEPLSPGVSLFPPVELHELRIRMAPPWKCAIYVEDADSVRSVGCYALSGSFYTAMISYFFSSGMAKARAGFRTLPLGAITPRSARVSISQWLLEKAGRRAIVSIYQEPSVGGRNALWISFVALAPNSHR